MELEARDPGRDSGRVSTGGEPCEPPGSAPAAARAAVKDATEGSAARPSGRAVGAKRRSLTAARAEAIRETFPIARRRRATDSLGASPL